jgi:hypothetical protein
MLAWHRPDLPPPTSRKGGKAFEHWPAIEKSLVERAEKKITIEETAKP